MKPEVLSERRPPARIGRPPTELAGEVEARILDAAAQVFMARGFDAASIGEIADVARAGKPTIYARFTGKEALLEAAFLRRLAQRNARLETLDLGDGSVEVRLKRLGVALVEETLSGDFIGLMRLAVAESRRLPDMGDGLLRLCRERGTRAVARLLAEGVGPPLGPAPDAPLALQAGRLFSENVLLPFLLRALAVGDVSALRAEIPDHVEERVRFFLAGLRNGGLAAG